MNLSATIGYGISITRAEVVKSGFIGLDSLADAIVDELPFMTRISNGDIGMQENVLIMVISNTVVTSYDFSQVFHSFPAVSADARRLLDAFLEKNLPDHETGWTLSAAN